MCVIYNGVVAAKSALHHTKRREDTMSKLFNWAAARLFAAFALALPLAATAAPTATAVWRSNLGQSYTIGEIGRAHV